MLIFVLSTCKVIGDHGLFDAFQIVNGNTADYYYLVHATNFSQTLVCHRGAILLPYSVPA
jgi:hypothetical protein